MNCVFLVYDLTHARAGAKCPFRAFKINEKWFRSVIRDEGNNLTVTNVA
jgi:hypothetical protein